jgi:predicted ATPase
LILFLDQVPTTRVLAVLTFRPEFTPPWRPRSHLTQLTLNRLGRQPVEAMVEKLTGGKPLPREVLQQIVAKTDGVPLFVEELTKSVVESVGAIHESPLQLAIPATLQDSLMARLDRLGMAKGIAQVGAVLGREFSYELLQAVSPLDETTLQQGLRQLVEAELLYQRGLPPQATYLFKHALIQDTAYHSLLKSTRQQYHHQIAQVLAERFAETTQTQPELLAHHYTEASLVARAIPYWQQAGERASQRSAYVEAINHLAKGLEVLKTRPDTPERTQRELDLQVILGPTLIATKGWGAPEVEQAYIRARGLCQQVEETAQLFPVLWGLWVFYYTREELQQAHELGKQLLNLAQSVQDSALLLEAHLTLGYTLHTLGEFVSARAHLQQSIALYDPQQHHALAFLYSGVDPGMASLSIAAWALWMLGYPDQALQRSRDAVTLARKLSHPHSLAFALVFATEFHQFRRERQAAQEQAEALITLATEQGWPYWPERVTITRGWALAEQGQGEEGITQIRQGLSAYRARGAELYQSHFLAMLAEEYRQVGQTAEGLAAVAEALDWAQRTGGRYYEAELYWLYGELSLRIGEAETAAKESENRGRGEAETSKRENLSSSPVPRFSGFPVLSSPARFPVSSPEECFQKAIEVAQKQQAKSLELRAVMSLVRLW